MTVELDLVSRASISKAFATIRSEAGEPDVLVFNAGYLEDRDDRLAGPRSGIRPTNLANLNVDFAPVGRLWSASGAGSAAGTNRKWRRQRGAIDVAENGQSPGYPGDRRQEDQTSEP